MENQASTVNSIGPSDIGELMSDDDLDAYLAGFNPMPWLTETDGDTNWTTVLGFSRYLEKIRSPAGYNGRRYVPSPWVAEANAARAAAARALTSTPFTSMDDEMEDTDRWAANDSWGLPAVNIIDDWIVSPPPKEDNSPAISSSEITALPPPNVPQNRFKLHIEGATAVATVLFPWLAILLAMACFTYQF